MKYKVYDFSCHHNTLQSLLHYSEIILHNKVLYSESNETNGIKIGLQLYNLWQIHGHQLNLRIANSKPLSPIWASSSISRKRQTRGLSPCVTYVLGSDVIEFCISWWKRSPCSFEYAPMFSLKLSRSASKI